MPDTGKPTWKLCVCVECIYLQVCKYVCVSGEYYKNKPEGHAAAALPFILKHGHMIRTTHVHLFVHVLSEVFIMLPLASLYSSQILLTAARPSCSSLQPKRKADAQINQMSDKPLQAFIKVFI